MRRTITTLALTAVFSGAKTFLLSLMTNGLKKTDVIIYSESMERVHRVPLI